jgi:hypothetical protein
MEKEKKRVKGPGESLPAHGQNKPAAQEEKPNRYPAYSLPLADRWDPPFIINLQPFLPP